MVVNSMRAAQLTDYGEPERLTLREVAAPTPGPSDVLVAVHAAAVNPVDCKIRQGSHRAILRPKLPVTLGMDVSGVVTAVGSAVTKFSVGDEVFASPNHRLMGGYAELAAIPERELARKPSRISHQEAAALPLVALTAWDALVRHGKLSADERVLIQAGAGGVGSIAIQLAKHLGAEVLTTCSSANTELVKSLGADVAIDYTSERYEEHARGSDLVVDTLGPEHLRREVATVRRGGRIMALTTGLPEAAERHGPWGGAIRAVVQLASIVIRARLRGVRVRPLARVSDGENLSRIAELVDAGAIRPLIDSVFDLDDVAAAHRRVDSGRCRGKVVLQVA
jgi:NADPH:quinone reductase-like Zn-dependent oxidoreductase